MGKMPFLESIACQLDEAVKERFIEGGRPRRGAPQRTSSMLCYDLPPRPPREGRETLPDFACTAFNLAGQLLFTWPGALQNQQVPSGLAGEFWGPAPAILPTRSPSPSASDPSGWLLQNAVSSSASLKRQNSIWDIVRGSTNPLSTSSNSNPI